VNLDSKILAIPRAFSYIYPIAPYLPHPSVLQEPFLYNRTSICGA
jgi:hypothetical protein